MSRTITIDDATYNTLKAQADYWCRTLSGQLRFIMSQYVGNDTSTPVDQAKCINSGSRVRTQKEMKIQELLGRLEELDEESDEYKDLLLQITQLQKGA